MLVGGRCFVVIVAAWLLAIPVIVGGVHFADGCAIAGSDYAVGNSGYADLALDYI